MSQAINFEKPPISEVVFSVSFDREELSLKSAHIGLFWNKLRADFPLVRDQVPLPHVRAPRIVEDLIQQNVDLGVTEMPPIRRSFFMSSDEGRIVQLQADRFVFNWRRQAPDEEYPRYARLRPEFDRLWDLFMAFLAEEGLPSPVLTAMELLYVNQIDASNGMGVAGLAGALVDHKRQSGPDRFLPEPIASNTMSAYRLPDDAGILNVTSYGNLKKLRIDMLARGLPTDVTPTSVSEWWDLAHDWIVRGFKDSTVIELHGEAWRQVL